MRKQLQERKISINQHCFPFNGFLKFKFINSYCNCRGKVKLKRQNEILAGFTYKKYSNEINGQKIFKRNNGRKKFKFQQREVSSHKYT